MAKKQGERVIVYVTESMVKAMKEQLRIATDEYVAAKSAKDIAADALALRRATFLEAIERLKTVVLAGQP